MSELWFKVLQGNKSCHGGDFSWSLPVGDQPGEWHSLPPGVSPRLCGSGFHVTREPAHWMDQRYTAYIVEIRGEVVGPDLTQSDSTKIAVSECRLIRPATVEELATVGVYISGKHNCVTSGKSVAFGNSQVTAWDNSQVTAWGNSQVTARDNSQVTARDNSQVTAWDNSQVTARDKVIVVVRYFGPKVNLSGLASEVSYVSGWAEFRKAELKPETAAKP